MKKIQLIVAWLRGLAISAVLILTSKIATRKGDLIFLAKDNKYLSPLSQLESSRGISLVILIACHKIHRYTQILNLVHTDIDMSYLCESEFYDGL